MAVTLAEVAGAVEAVAPLDLAEDWDRPGLQVGDPRSRVAAVLVALDPSPAAVAEAVASGTDLLVTHHPLLLRPLSRVDTSRIPGSLVADLVRADVGLYAAHTNLDRAEGGVNDVLAERLGLEDVASLGAGEPRRKVVVTVPAGYESGVRRALGRAGAGRVGRYAGCTFGGRGTGVFTPLEGAEPFSGEPGREERADEVRLEVSVDRSRLGPVLAAVREVHPYEEPAVDVYPLEGGPAGGALGRLGRLPAARRLGEWVREATERLGAPGARLVGDADVAVERVAVCGGSGASLWREARRSGAEVLVTGDVKYHDALDAEAEGFALLDVGHGPSEGSAVEALDRILRSWARGAGEPLQVEIHRHREPFHWFPARV